MRYFILLLAIALGLSACVSPKGLYKQGNYQEAVLLAAQKIRKNPSKDKHKLVLEAAYKESVSKELQQIDFLKKEGDPAKWEQILGLYERIREKQQAVNGLLPLYIKKEYRNADITLINVDDELLQAKRETARFLYAKANKLLQEGGKYEAREAFYTYGKLLNLYSTYEDAATKIQQAKAKGTVHVLVDLKNNSPMNIYKDFTNELFRFNPTELQTEWAQFHTSNAERIAIDKYLVIQLDQIAIGPEQVKERDFQETATVEDGWEYVYDAKGNVKKDSLGNDIKQKKMVKVVAFVKEINQHKEGDIIGNFQLLTNTKDLVQQAQKPYDVKLVFDNIAATFRGDKRALTKETSKRIGGSPAPFPTNYQMTMDGVKSLKNELFQFVRNSRGIIEQ